MATVHELTDTVLAPAYALSAADGQIGGGAQGVPAQAAPAASEAAANGPHRLVPHEQRDPGKP